MSNQSFHIINIILFIFPYILTSGQIVHQKTVNSIVLIEKKVEAGYKSHGTGFLYYNYEFNINDPRIIVVTCGHVIANEDSLTVRINPSDDAIDAIKKKNGNSRLISYQGVDITDKFIRITTKLDDKNSYIHPHLDIAAFYVKAPILFQLSDSTATPIKAVDYVQIPKSQFRERSQIRLGEEVYFIGFPFGLGGQEIVEPVLRTGSVAWLPSNADTFMLDAFSFGGNSGSPVFLKSSFEGVGNTVKEGLLIGMVYGHNSSKIENVLIKSNKNKKILLTTLNLNIGLANCVYAEDIMYTIEKLVEN